jgi:hypothetical protein
MGGYGRPQGCKEHEYDSKTVAYLHSVEILVKSLSDETVLLIQENNSWTPIVTGLEQARQVSATSSV